MSGAAGLLKRRGPRSLRVAAGKAHRLGASRGTRPCGVYETERWHNTVARRLMIRRTQLGGFSFSGAPTAHCRVATADASSAFHFYPLLLFHSHLEGSRPPSLHPLKAQLQSLQTTAIQQIILTNARTADRELNKMLDEDDTALCDDEVVDLKAIVDPKK